MIAPALRSLAWPALACLVSMARGALAQDVRDTPPALPPRLLEDAGAVYPERAVREGVAERVAVDLVVEVDETGRVVRATVETPRGHGFDEAALAAAEGLRFEPALRGDTPVASRIRFRYVFDPPAPPVSPARPALPRASAVAPAPEPVPVPSGEERPIEIQVRGERLAPAAQSYQREEVRRIPGAFGDPFRAIETLPGVTPVASGLPFFYVRGAPPGNVGYFLDGVRVPYLYHVGLGPSVVQPALVLRVDYYPGGYPARFGHYAGGIVSAPATAPRPELHGEGNLRLFDAGGFVEFGFADRRGTALLGGRYSYTGALLSLAAPEVQLDYHDIQLRVSYDVTSKDRVSVFGFGSYDLLAEQQEGADAPTILFASEFYRVDVRHDHTFDAGRLRTAVTLGYDRTHAATLVPDDPRNLVNRTIGLRSEVRTELGPRVLALAGASTTLDDYGTEGAYYVDPDAPGARQFEQAFPARIDHTLGAFVDLTVDASDRIQVLPGVRADLYGSGSDAAVGVDPRLAARFDVAPSVRILPALGLAHQRPSFIVPLPGIAPPLGEGLQRTVQTSAGAEVDVAEATTLGVAGFYNRFFALSDSLESTGGDPSDPASAVRTEGFAFGGEVFLRRRLTRRLGGFVTYTLSRSVRVVDGIRYVSAFDRPHVLNVALSYGLGRGWTAGSRFLFYSGIPRAEHWDVDDGGRGERSRDVERQPSYYRLDARLEKRWALRGTGWVSFVLEFLNATLNKETWPGGEEVGPVAIPSLGVEGGF